MSSKHKLNSAYLTGAVIVAALAGVATNSWLVFLVTGIIFTALNIVGGFIRE